MLPLVCYVTWNRMGMTVQNLNLLLKTSEDFELYIIDNDSSDDTWAYLQTIKDPRIKEIKKFSKNYGLIYALNYAISKRKPGQPFINVDQDVSILTDDWITNCEEVIKEFPEIGILGNVRPTYFQERNVKYAEKVRNGKRFWQTGHLMGCCMYFPSETMDVIGYFNEELCLADLEINARMSIYKKWIGYCPDNHILYQAVKCETCNHENICTTPQNTECFKPYGVGYKHREFSKMMQPKLHNFTNKLNKNNLYSASIHDLESQKKVTYDREAAVKNFEFYAGSEYCD